MEEFVENCRKKAAEKDRYRKYALQPSPLSIPEVQPDERLRDMIEDYIQSVAEENYPSLTQDEKDVIERKHLVAPFTTTKNIVLFSIFSFIIALATGSVFIFPSMILTLMFGVFVAFPVITLLYQSEMSYDEVLSRTKEIDKERDRFVKQNRLYIELSLRKGRDPEDILKIVEKDITLGLPEC